MHTNKDEAKAIAIPGQRDTHLAKVENELYHELCTQHDRAGLFVTAKADEINRRLRMRHLLFLLPFTPIVHDGGIPRQRACKIEKRKLTFLL